jgi:phosphoglycolate phosphatase
LSQVYCVTQSLLGIEAIIFDKDGTLADSAPFLKRLAQTRSQRCVDAILANGRGEVSSPANTKGTPAGFPITYHPQPFPSDLVDQLLATLGVWENRIDPDGLMAAGTRQSNIDALVEVLLGIEVSSQPDKSESNKSEIQTLVAKQFALADGDLSPKALYTPPFLGTREMLQRLSQSAIKLGVLSSASPAHVEEFLRHYDLLPWIDDWQGTGPEDVPKPNPALLHRLCGRMGVDPRQGVIVGDSWVDQALAEQANTAGFISVSEAWGRPPVAGSDLILRRWEDLKIVPQRHTAS